MRSQPDVTVIVPVYNKRRFLPVLLDSLAAQDLPSTAYEVLAVDDGSTDGSGELLDEYAERHDWLRVVHQPNSGWPGLPRNRGLAESDSTYVFFADADDYLGAEALRRMLRWAEEYGSDILIPKMVATRDPDAPNALFVKNLAEVPIPLRFKTLRPTKLFRREFLDEHGLRFVEHRAPLEDGMLLARAYLLTPRVSIAADYTYYYIVPGEETSISGWRRDPWAQRQSVGTMLSTVRLLCPDPAAADEVCLDLYRRKGIRYIAPNRLPNYGHAFREQHVLAAADLAEAYMPVELEQRLRVPFRFRSRLVRTRDADACCALALAERSGPPPVRVLGDGLVLDTGPGRATVDVTADVRLRLQRGRIRATADGAMVTGELLTRGVRLNSTDPIAVNGAAEGAKRRRLAMVTATPGGAPDTLRISAGMSPAVIERTAGLGAPVRVTVEVQSYTGKRVLAAPLAPAVDFAALLAEHRQLKEEARAPRPRPAAPVRRRLGRAVARYGRAHASAGVRRLARVVRDYGRSVAARRGSASSAAGR